MVTWSLSLFPKYSAIPGYLLLSWVYSVLFWFGTSKQVVPSKCNRREKGNLIFCLETISVQEILCNTWLFKLLSFLATSTRDSAEIQKSYRVELRTLHRWRVSLPREWKIVNGGRFDTKWASLWSAEVFIVADHVVNKPSYLYFYKIEDHLDAEVHTPYVWMDVHLYLGSTCLM